MSTHDVTLAASEALIERLEKLSSAEQEEQFRESMELVMTCAYTTEVWTLQIVPMDNDGFGSDAVAYHCDIPESARALSDVSGYLKSAEWLETLFRMSQDYDGFHGPHAANLD